MGDSRRVFVQLAQLQSHQLHMGSPVMAFVQFTDPWLTVVNEFVMSCYDDDIEVDKRPRGMLESCAILHASTLAHLTDVSAFEDGKQYILCPTPDVFEAVFRKHGMQAPTPTPTPTPTPSPSPPPAPALAPAKMDSGGERPSIVTTDQLESLEELSYYFDEHGTLRHCATNQAVYEIMSDERRANEIDEIVKAAIFHIQMDMLAELDFKQAHVPLDPQPHEPKEARSSVFLTSDWRSNKNLLLVINGGRGAQPGIWSRDLLIQEGQKLGSMLPVFRRAKAAGYAVAVLNPFTNNVTIGNELFPIRHNASPDEHILYVWDHILSRAQAENVYILAYSFGAKLVTTLLQNREAAVVRRLRAVVFAEAAYRFDQNSTSPMVGQFLRQRAINFKADPTIPVGHHMPAIEEQLSCNCLSVGDSTAEHKAPLSSSPTVSKRSSSNKARTISLALETTFTYFIGARDRGISAPEFISESEKRTRSWLGNVIRQRLDSLKPRKQTRRTSGMMGDAPPNKGAKRVTMTDASAMRAPSDREGASTSSSSSASTSTSSSCAVSVSDFDLIKVIGKGSIGKVFLVRKVNTDIVYAMKVLRKKNVMRHGLKEHIETERLILEEIDHPFIARLRFSFQTKDKLYLVTDYCSGGELFHHMTDAGFAYELSKFYAAELVLGLEHLHRLKVAYRDLKPENILLEASGHLRITDFGLSKLNVVSDHGAQTLVGSPEYLAPEVYSMKKYGFAVDWWSLGVFLYEMLTGVHPFFDDNREVMVQKIMTPGIMEKIMPRTMPREAASLLFGLLTFEPAERLGSRERGAEEIRSHPFFAGMDWDKVRLREVLPPWKPTVRDELDVGNFDAEFTSEPVIDSVCTQQSMVMGGTFDNFTFDPNISSMRKR